jgi:hypothetical protein
MDQNKKSDFQKHFRTPESYFEDVPGRIQERIGAKSPRRIPAFAPRLVYALALFAVVAYFVIPQSEPEQVALDNDAVVEYLVSETDLAFVEESYLDYVVLSESDETIEYLLEEGIDLNVIIEELEI